MKKFASHQTRSALDKTTTNNEYPFERKPIRRYVKKETPNHTNRELELCKHQ